MSLYDIVCLSVFLDFAIIGMLIVLAYHLGKMNKSKKNINMTTNKRGCITEICILLLVAFIVLKLTKVITWSWWWVLSPAWIYVGLWLILIIFAFIGAIVSDN